MLKQMILFLQKLMLQKDDEIDRLNSKIGELIAQIPNTQALDADRANTALLREVNLKLVLSKM